MEDEEIAIFEAHSFKYNSTIAEGCFGSLLLIYSPKTQLNYCLKRMHESRFNQTDLRYIEKIEDATEIELYTYYKFQDYVYILQDYSPNDIYFSLKKQAEFTDDQLMKYCREILLTVKQYHDENISQNDIRPTNFVFDKFGRIRVSSMTINASSEDFHSSPSHTGTMLFMAPEVFRKKSYDPLKSDIWSIGVTFYCMATKNYPYYATNLNTFLKILNTGIYPVFTVENTELRNIIIKCLDFDPNNRPAVTEILSMPYFKKLNTPSPMSKLNVIKTAKSTSELQSPFMKKMFQDSSTRISQVPFRRRMFNARSMKAEKQDPTVI